MPHAKLAKAAKNATKCVLLSNVASSFLSVLAVQILNPFAAFAGLCVRRSSSLGWSRLRTSAFGFRISTTEWGSISVRITPVNGHLFLDELAERAVDDF